MGNINIRFLEKDYIFPEELVEYVRYLRKFEPYYERAMEPLIQQIHEKEYSGGADVDFAYFRNPLKEIVEDVIKDLSSNGVFSVSIKELLDDNVGYQKLHQVCSDCFEKDKEIMINAIENYTRGYENAYNSAISQVTGLDYSIITNSTSMLLAYSVLESNEINKQMKRADKEYRAIVSELSERNQNEIERQKADLLVNTYYPNAAEAIGIFSDTLFSKYISALVDNGRFDLSKIMLYDMKHSSNLLQNLSLIESKENVIQEAFEACPYNVKVYTSAIENNIIDENMLKIAIIFGFDKELVELLNEYCLNHKEKIDKINCIVNALASYEKKDKKDIYANLYQDELKKTINTCNSFFDLLKDKKKCAKWVETNIARTTSSFIQIADDQIKNIITNIVSQTILTDSINNLLKNGIFTNDEVFPFLNNSDSSSNCISDLMLQVIDSILAYKQEVIQYEAESSAKLEILKKKYQESEELWKNKNEELDKLIKETTAQINNLRFFAFSKKKELSQKLGELWSEKEKNPVKNNYLIAEQEYKDYARQLEKLIYS